MKTGAVLMLSKWGCGGQEVTDEVSEGPILSNWSCLTTFIKGSPPKNGSNHVKTGAILMLSKWDCRGQKVPVHWLFAGS